MRSAARADGPAVSLQRAPSTATRAAAQASLRVAVSPPHESYGLGEPLGECRELVGALGEILNGSELFRRRGRDGLRLLGGRLRALLRLGERPADAGDQIGVGPGRVRDALAGARGAGRRLRDTVQVFYPIAGTSDHLAQIGPDPLQQLCGPVQGAAGLLHRSPDVARLPA